MYIIHLIRDGKDVCFVQFGFVMTIAFFYLGKWDIRKKIIE